MLKRWGCLAAIAATLLMTGAARAGELAPPTGPVVLTVAGAVDNTNRGPVEPFADAFFAFHDIAFERAAAFDLAALEALGLHEVRAGYPNWPGVSVFEGPLLADVLAAAGATGERIRLVALDGYASELTMADLAAYPAILALKRDGDYLGLGGRGPTWLVYPREDYPALQAAEDDAGLAWAAFFIEIE